MARVLKGSHSFTCTPRVQPLTELTIPAFALNYNWARPPPRLEEKFLNFTEPYNGYDDDDDDDDDVQWFNVHLKAD